MSDITQPTGVELAELIVNKSKFALLDNSAVQWFLTMEQAGIDPEVLLQRYDCILIPGWVRTEINDGQDRVNMVESFRVKNLPVYDIPERVYSYVIGDDGVVNKLIGAVARDIQDVNKFVRQKFYSREDSYFCATRSSRVFDELYANWPLGKDAPLTMGGRAKKKNAGEFSLAVLAATLLTSVENAQVSIFTSDSDCKEYLGNMCRQISKHPIPVGVTNPEWACGGNMGFKTPSALIQDLVQDGTVGTEWLASNLARLWQPRRVEYIATLSDGSASDAAKTMTAEDFQMLLVRNDKIIF